MSGRFTSMLRRAAQWIRNLFEGARYTLERSYIPEAVQSARFDISQASRMELVRKSRYFEKNNGIMNRLADLFETYTVGQSLSILADSSEPDWNRLADSWWGVWAQYPDLVTRQSLGTLESLIARTWFIDGEVFIVLTRGESGLPRVQLVEGHLVQTPPELAAQEGVTIVDGILLDPNGRPRAYYIAEEDERGRKRFPAPKPAEFVIHLFEPSRPGQLRGLPMCYPVINDLHDLDDLHVLEMRAAKDAAEITTYVTSKAGEASAQDLRRARFSTSTTLSTGASATVPANEFTRPTAGGREIHLKNGEEVKQFRSERPSVATKEYWRYKTELICAGVGIPYVLVFPDSMQGTVYRGALDMANSFFRARHLVLADALRRIWSYVMGWARTRVPTLVDPPADWMRVAIQPPRAVNVDIGRNSSAMLAELKAGATNYELIYGPLGLNWRDELRKLAVQVAFARQLGLDLSESVPPLGTSATTPAPQDPVPAS